MRRSKPIRVTTVSISDNLLKLAESNQAELVLFAPGSVPDSVDFRRYVWRFEGHRTQLAVVPSLVDVAADRIRTRPVGGMPTGLHRRLPTLPAHYRTLSGFSILSWLP